LVVGRTKHLAFPVVRFNKGLALLYFLGGKN